MKEDIKNDYQKKMDAQLDKLWDEGILDQKRLDEINKMDLHQLMREDKERLTQIKKDFIQKIESENSLDTLKSWFDMYDEARYVASINSEEPELREEYAKTMARFKKGISNR